VAGYLASNRKQNEMTDSFNTVVAPSREEIELWRYGGLYYEEKKGVNTRRCVRGVPIGREIWLPGDGPAGEPANENIRGGRYPLEEEYRAKRLGKLDDEADVLWATAKWFAGHHEIANREPNACSYGLGRKVDAGELGGFVDAEVNEEAMGSGDPIGFQIEMNVLRSIAPIDTFFVDARDRGESELIGVEHRVRSVKICQHLKYRLDCNYRHLVDAVVNRCEMKAIGLAEGVKEGAAAAGRMFVRAGLRTATLVRLDITRWEVESALGREHTIGPLPRKPEITAAMQAAANDDVRRYVRNVA
jgi:hypothetical protein